MTDTEWGVALENSRAYLYTVAHRHSPCLPWEDLIQETLARAWTNRCSYHGPALMPWLATILRNVIIDTLRRQERSPDPLPLDPHLMERCTRSRMGDPAEQACRRMEAQELLRVMERLSREKRSVLRALGEGYNYEEIAARYRLPPGTCKSRIYRARRDMARLVEEA